MASAAGGLQERVVEHGLAGILAGDDGGLAWKRT